MAELQSKSRLVAKDFDVHRRQALRGLQRVQPGGEEPGAPARPIAGWRCTCSSPTRTSPSNIPASTGISPPARSRWAARASGARRASAACSTTSWWWRFRTRRTKSRRRRSPTSAGSMEAGLCGDEVKLLADIQPARWDRSGIKLATGRAGLRGRQGPDSGRQAGVHLEGRGRRLRFRREQEGQIRGGDLCRSDGGRGEVRRRQESEGEEAGGGEGRGVQGLPQLGDQDHVHGQRTFFPRNQSGTRPR